MKHILLFGFLLAIAENLLAQKETFDIISYRRPEGWKKEINGSVTGLSFIDKKDKSWCQIGIYKSTESKGSIEKDFESEWNELVKKAYQVQDTAQSSDIKEAGGWKIKTGSGKFSFHNKPAASILTTFSGYGRCVSIVATTANERYLQDIQDLIASVELIQPDTARVALLQESPLPGHSGFRFNTSSFDDGWHSTIYDDFVLTTKGNIQVLLSYAEKFSASEFAGTGQELRFYYWDHFVSRYFVTGIKRYNTGAVSNDMYGAYREYIEGPATDKQSGEQRYIAMILRIIPGTGTLSVIIASAPDEGQLRMQFPKISDEIYNDLLPMYGYNKFPVGKDDLIGTWSNSGGETMNWYSTTTGENVGATGAASSDQFTFSDGANYRSIHKGASGLVGAMKTFQLEYNGTYTVSDWLVTASNRKDGRTDSFDAWFEVIKGGRVLHLRNRQYTAMEFILYKDK